MVKVSGGARTLAGVHAHLAYIGRHGDLGVHTDDGQVLSGEAFEKSLTDDWNLSLEDHRRQDGYAIRGVRKPAKLVHNLIFSMPPGTPPKKLLKAVSQFALNEFALTHRYAFTLHTDQDHPHVHVVVKAMSEQVKRLNIRKATLRHWRQQFAEHLRREGVAANATERAVRGQTRPSKTDGLLRRMRRGEALEKHRGVAEFIRDRPQASAKNDRSRAGLTRTREAVQSGWAAIANRFQHEGDWELAAHVRRFADRQPPIQTTLEHLFNESRTARTPDAARREQQLDERTR